MKDWVADVTRLIGCLGFLCGIYITYSGNPNGVAISALGVTLAGGTHFVKNRMQTPAATIEEGDDGK